MEHFSFSPEPPSVREVASHSDDGRSFFYLPDRSSLPGLRIPVVFIWADSILDVYAFFLAALRFPFSFFPFARSRCIFYKEEWAPPAVLCGSHTTKCWQAPR